MDIEEQTFKRALGRLLAGVTVVTTRVDSAAHGMTASSVCRLSDDPPLVLVCVNNGATLHQKLQQDRWAGFAISILAEEQEALSSFFAGYGALDPDPLATALRTGHDGAPILDGCLGWFDCARYAEHTAGSHTIYVGRVVDVGLGEDLEANPLTYFRGKYRRIS